MIAIARSVQANDERAGYVDQPLRREVRQPLDLLAAAEQRAGSVVRLAVCSGSVIQAVMRRLARHPASAGKGADLAMNSVDFYTTTDPELLERVLFEFAVSALNACPPGERIQLGSIGIRGGRFWCWSPGYVFSRDDARDRECVRQARVVAERFLAGEADCTTRAEGGTTFNVWL